MDQININRNIFLEKEELSNLQSFLAGGLLRQMLVQASYSFGIVWNNTLTINKKWHNKVESTDIPEDFANPSFVPFKLTVGNDQGLIKVGPGMIFTDLGEIINISKEENVNVSIPSNDTVGAYFLTIKRITRNYEIGTVSVNAQGTVSGTVNFNGKVRGQSTSTPTYIRFEKSDGSVPLNNGVYQVVNLIDDYDLNLTSSTTFVSETDLRVIIVGTVPLGGNLTQDQKKGLYTYDGYEFDLVYDESGDVPEVSGDTFVLGSIKRASGKLQVDDSDQFRSYWILGNTLLNKSAE